MVTNTAPGRRSLHPGLIVDREALPEFCRATGIANLAIFGSALRDDFGPDSDVDVLVTFLPGKLPNLLQLIRMERELSSVFLGRKVDLRLPGELSRYFREDVERSALTQYVHQ